jgi:hypothetical protein
MRLGRRVVDEQRAAFQDFVGAGAAHGGPAKPAGQLAKGGGAQARGWREARPAPGIPAR